MDQKKIGFMGLAMAGKSHVGKLWAEKTFERTGILPLRVDIALPLKQQVANQFGVPLSVVEANKQDFRVYLQEMGRLYRSYCGESYLIDKAIQQAEGHRFAYIENVRMPNEVVALTKAGWCLVGLIIENDSVRIQRFVDKYGRPPTEEESNHETEKYIMPMIEAGACHLVLRNEIPEEPEWIAEFLAQWAQGII